MRLVYVTLGWVIGIIWVVEGGSRSPLAWGVLTLLASLTIWLMWRSSWRWLFIALLALTLGGLRAAFVQDTSPLAALNNLGGMTITGIVIDEPDRRDTGIFVRIDAQEVTRIGQTTLTAGVLLAQVPRTADVRYGDRVRVTGQPEQPGVYDTFSYADYLAQQQVFSVMRNSRITIIERDLGNPVYAWMIARKSEAAQAINRSIPEPQAGLLVGILLGNERGISPELKDDFARTGAAHIIAISGFNMAILAGAVILILEKTPLHPILSALIAVTVLAVYTIFVGANAAVLRAAVMSAMLVIGRAFKRETYVPASLAFVALVMSAVNPRVLWSVSFQLSFFATLGLALFATPFARSFETWLKNLFPGNIASFLNGMLSESVIVSLAALVTTLPLTVLYFQRLSLVQILVNVLIVPVQTAVLLGGLLALLLAPIAAPLAQIVFWFEMALLWWTVSVIRWFASWQFADVELYLNQQWVLLFFIAIIGGAMVQATQPRWVRQLGHFARTRAVFSAIVLIGVVMTGLNSAVFLSRPDGNLHLHLLDVGHSNGILVTSPNGAQILIDGGRFPSRLLTHIGDRVPFQDRQLDVLVITQPDGLQLGALPAVLARYDVGLAITNGQPNQTDEFIAVQEALGATPIVEATAGYTLTFDDGLLLEVLHPTTKPTLTDSLDDNTLVLRLTYREVSFLLTSDLSITGQQMLLDAGHYPLADVMQLPQHATARSLSSTFIETVQPQVLLLQSDPANRRGDPDPDLLTRLPNSVPLLRTDTLGSIHLWTDGETLWYIGAEQPS